MSEDKDFKKLVIFGIVVMFVFSSVTVAGISVSNTNAEIKNIIDEKDTYDDPSGLISKIVTWFRSFFGRDDSSEQSSRILDSSENEPYSKGDRALVWNATLSVIETSGKNDNCFFGEDPSASDGQDYNDAPNLGGPPTGDYLDCYFSEPFGNYMQDIKHYPDTYKVWNLSVDWIPDGDDYGTNVTLSWDIDELDDSEYNKITLRRKGQYNSTWYNVSDMLSESSFSWDHESFWVEDPGFWYWYLDDEFMIICEYIDEPTITVNIPLEAGWNLITVPVNIAGFNASNLKENITGCQSIGWFDSAAQIFRVYTGNPASDFVILDGCGLLLYTTAGSTLTLTGMPITTVSVPINAGWNVIGWFNASDTTAISLHGNITGCQSIGWFDSAAQIFRVYTGNPASDFVISQGMGLMLYTTTSSVWHGEG